MRKRVDKAARTLRFIDWFEWQTVRGSIEDGGIKQFQAQLKIVFRLE